MSAKIAGSRTRSALGRGRSAHRARQVAVSASVIVLLLGILAGAAAGSSQATSTPSPTKAATVPLHNFSPSQPAACGGDGGDGIVWGTDSLGVPGYVRSNPYRECLMDFNPTAGSVSATYEDTTTDYGQTWDKVAVTVSPGATIPIGPPGGPVFENARVDSYYFYPEIFACNNGTIPNLCAPQTPFLDPAGGSTKWTADDPTYEVHPYVISPSDAIPGITAPTPDYFPPACGFGAGGTTHTCNIEVERPPSLQNGMSYWYRITAYGMADNGSRTVQVKDLAIHALPGLGAEPVASFTGAASAPGSLTWNFDGSASTPGAGASLSTYSWDFGDGDTGTGAQVAHTFTRAGTYVVALTVTDSSDRTDTKTISFDVTTPTLIVNSTGDAAAADPTQSCATGQTIPSGDPECTLRSAIQALDAGTGGATITFDIAGDTTITPGSDLPAITAADATIDGTTQPTGEVTVRGKGLSVTSAPRFTMKDVAIVGGTGNALVLQDSPHSSVSGSSIGVAPDGTLDPPDSGLVVVGSSGTTIGGSTPADANVIGARSTAVTVAPSLAHLPSDDVSIIGNRIGVTSNGTPIADGGLGLVDLGSGADSAKSLVVSNNTIAGFKSNVVVAGDGTAGAKITANRVGLDPTAAHVVGAPVQNIRLDAVPSATVGSNIVSGATYDILVAGSLQLGLTQGTDGTYSISYNFPGVGTPDPGAKTGTDDNVSGNTVGLVAPDSGSSPADGIRLWEAADGATVATNHVSGHHDAEIEVSGGANQAIRDNTVGIDHAAQVAGSGVVVDHTDSAVVDGNAVGGTSSALLVTASTSATIENNTTGLGADGATAAPDAVVGIGISSDSPDATIGPNNVVANTTGVGLSVAGGQATITANRFGVPQFGGGWPAMAPPS